MQLKQQNTKQKLSTPKPKKPRKIYVDSEEFSDFLYFNAASDEQQLYEVTNAKYTIEEKEY